MNGTYVPDKLAVRPDAPGFEQSSAIASAMQPQAVGAVAVAATAEAELKAQIVQAREFRRDGQHAYATLMQSCGRAAFAEGCVYRFPRGGTQIEGPSVQLAREAARAWQNMRFGVRIISETDESVHLAGYAFDLERNVYAECHDQFAKLIRRKQSKDRGAKAVWVPPKDERDLRELINRRGSLAERNAICKVLPADLIADGFERAKQTIRDAAQGNVKQTRGERIKRMVIAYGEIGVTTDMLKRWATVEDLGTISVEQIEELSGIYTSIRDGAATKTDHFPLPTVDELASLRREIRLLRAACPREQVDAILRLHNLTPDEVAESRDEIALRAIRDALEQNRPATPSAPQNDQQTDEPSGESEVDLL